MKPNKKSSKFKIESKCRKLKYNSKFQINNFVSKKLKTKFQRTKTIIIWIYRETINLHSDKSCITLKCEPTQILHLSRTNLIVSIGWKHILIMSTTCTHKCRLQNRHANHQRQLHNNKIDLTKVDNNGRQTTNSIWFLHWWLISWSN